MTSNSTGWDEDLATDPEEEYQTLVRVLKRKKGFGLFFVRCSQTQGEQLIKRVREDIPHKRVEVLRFVQAIDDLYNRVANLPNRENIDILFIQGLEYSLYQYELKTFGAITELHFDDFRSVPRILNHLNQQRERFRDDFNICFVFLVCPFTLKYFIHRAPDFFDWRSAVFEFPTNPEVVEQESSRLILEADYEKYLKLTPTERVKTILEIQDLLAADHQTLDNRLSLLFELGKLLVAAKEYVGAISSYDQALKLKPDYDLAWNGRGIALGKLGRIEEAISSFDQALKLKPDYHSAWYNRGNALGKLGRIEEAIYSFDQALKLKPDYNSAWYNRGNTLAILGRFEEAIYSFDQALKLKSDKDTAWYNKACCYALQGNVEQAIENLQQAIKLSPDECREWAKTDSDFDSIREDERFQALIQEPLSDN